MSTLDELIEHVEPHVPGCPEPMMIQALHARLRELCSRSQVWRERLPKLDVFEGLSDYQMDVPYNMEIVAIRQLYWGDEPIDFRTIDRVRATDGGDDDSTGQHPDYWTMPEINVIRIYPAPDDDYDKKIEPYAAVTLAQGESEFSSDLMRFAQGIAAGATARLKLMANVPWTDREGYRAFEQEFQAAVGDANRLSMTAIRGQAGHSHHARFNPP